MRTFHIGGTASRVSEQSRFDAKNNGSVRFTGQGPIRTVYFGILGSHTLLAIVVLPLVLRTLYLGLRRKDDKHRRIARFTLPIWLYVSVTGVIVYWMLYHLYAPGPIR
jgi:putative membrane protein